MKHARPDYDRIQDPDGKIPQDEPVFLLRAQDRYASLAVAMYAYILDRFGCDDRLVRMARDHVASMDAWPIKKDPDFQG